MITGMMCQDLTKQLPIAMVVQTAADAYEKRFGKKATHVELHVSHAAQAVLCGGLAGLDVRFVRTVQPHCALAGIRTTEDTK